MAFYNCFLITVFVLPDTYDTDGYNPEAPSITNTSRPMYRHRVHAQRPNLIGLTSGDMDLPPRGTMINLFFLLSYQEWQNIYKEYGPAFILERIWTCIYWGWVRGGD